jgi:hypothetical protein
MTNICVSHRISVQHRPAVRVRGRVSGVILLKRGWPLPTIWAIFGQKEPPRKRPEEQHACKGGAGDWVLGQNQRTLGLFGT